MSAHTFDPEKTYVVVHHGPYEGRYPVYRTLARFRKDHPKTPVVIPWFKGEEADWVQTDDGYVCQVIRTYWLGGKKKRKRLTKVVRVAWNSFPYYERLDGSTSSRMHFSPKRANSPASMAKHSTPRHGKSWTTQKKYFAWLVVAKDLEPYQAYMKAFKTVSISRARRLSRELMKEDRLVKEVADIYKKLFDAAGMTDEDIASQIAGIAKTNKSGKVRLDALRLALELRGEAPTGANLNVRFPQLGGAGAAAGGAAGAGVMAVHTAGQLKAPPKALPEASPEAIDTDGHEDMTEAVVIDDEIEDDMEVFRLPTGGIRASGNINYLQHQQRRSMEKLRWEREEGLTEERRATGETVITKSPNHDGQDSSDPE